MIIGIDGSRAFSKERTGIEEYSYQVIKNLRNELKNSQVVLYLRKGQKIDFDLFADEAGLLKNWKVKVLKWPRFWTQCGLSLEMLFHPMDVLFIPAHTAPFIHPRKTFVVVHGLEYEVMKEAYSFFSRFYMRHSIKFSCRWAKKIIAVSKNTKKDLVELYKVPENKIEVIYEGVNVMRNYPPRLAETTARPLRRIEASRREAGEKHANLRTIPNTKYQIRDTKYLLFVGRLEKRKNIVGMISAFEILKEKYKIPHKLILAGNASFGYEEIKNKAENSEYKDEIIEVGFVKEQEKYELIKNADVFLFPTFYEGFGLPILEAQSLGVPVVTSNTSSLPEVGGESVVYCTPQEPISIATAIYEIISEESFKDGIIKKGYGNAEKFSWEKCAKQISEVLVG